MNNTKSPNSGSISSEDDLDKAFPFSQERYQVNGVIGVGGVGKVYHAFDLQLLRNVAIKVIPYTDEEALKEAQALARLDHSNIVKVYDVLSGDGYLAIVMERVDSAEALNMDKIEEMEPDLFFSFYRQVLAAVEAIHTEDLLHLDLKPGNILYDNNAQVKVTDFGISICQEALKNTPQSESQSTRKGSWYCLSPEQIEGERLSEATDIFALGILLYSYLYKSHPFLEIGDMAASRENISLGRIKSTLVSSSISSPELEALVVEMLSRSPNKRPQLAKVAQVIASINSSQHPGEMPTQTFEFPPLDKNSKWQSRRPWIFAGLSLLILSAISVVLLISQQPVRSTLVIPTVKPDGKQNILEVRHQDYNFLVATIVEDELEAAVIRDESRKLISKKEWRGDTNWGEVAKRLNIDDILISQVECEDEFCNINVSIYKEEKSNNIHILNRTIPNADLMILSQVVQQVLFSSSYFSGQGLANDISDQVLRVYYDYKIKQEKFQLSENDLAELRAFASDNPHFLGAQIVLGTAYYSVYLATRNESWLKKSHEFATQLLHDFPNDAPVIELNYKNYVQANDFEAAGKMLDRFKGVAGVDINKLVLSEVKLLFKQSPADAYKLLLAHRKPRLTESYFHHKAHMEDALGFVEDLEKTAKSWQAKFPDSHMPNFYLGKVYLFQGKLNDAIETNRIFYNKQLDFNSLSNLALCQMLAGRYQESSESFRSLLDISPSPSALLNLAEALKAAGDEESRTYFLRALDAYETVSDPQGMDYAYKALVLAHLNRKDAAAIALQTAARTTKKDRDFYLAAAYIYSVLGQKEAALFNAKEAERHGFKSHWFNLPWTKELYLALSE